jgi:hypothetical protein
VSIPDAPWVGKCREDYYGYDEEETVRCDDCGEEFDREDMIEVEGIVLCKECYAFYHGKEDDDELYG